MIGLEVADGAVPACHAEPLNGQVWRGGREYPGDAWVNPQDLRVVPPCSMDAILALSGGGAVRDFRPVFPLSEILHSSTMKWG